MEIIPYSTEWSKQANALRPVGALSSVGDESYLAAFLRYTSEMMFYDQSPALEIGVHTCDYEGNSVLDYACLWGDLRAVKLLVERGADINAIGEMGVTPLHNAVRAKSAEIARYLLNLGAIQVKNKFDDTPYETAQWLCKTEPGDQSASVLKVFSDR